MVTLIATETEGEVLEPGIYRVRLEKVEEKAGTKMVENPDGTSHSEPSIYLRWTFPVIEDGFEDAFPLRANSSTAFGPNAKARGWAEALLGRNLNPNEPCDFDEQLIGCECMATVKIKQVGEKTYNEIESLAPIRKGKKAAPQNGTGDPEQVLGRLEQAIKQSGLTAPEVLREWHSLGFKGRKRTDLTPQELMQAATYFEGLEVPPTEPEQDLPF